MTLLEQLKNNKGTVSSALGKDLAKKVLSGDIKLLTEALDLCIYESPNENSKNVRAGAAKIVQIVSKTRPDLVAPHLKHLETALNVAEPQTRWMIIQTYGNCVKENPIDAVKGIKYAEKYIKEKGGICLSGSAEIALGMIGSISKRDSQTVKPILCEALKNALPNEVDWILEAFINIWNNLNQKSQEEIIDLIKKYQKAPKKSTQNRVSKLLKMYKG